MSTALAIAAATATLQSMLLKKMLALDPDLMELGNLEVTAQPPDLARKGVNPQLNVFLYHTALNAGWRNQDAPNQSKPGERGLPPLALNLYYMITAYAAQDNDNATQSSHRVLCSAMSVLHDNPVLTKAEIETALPNSGLAQQLERVRITPQPLSVDEIYKLWTAYQSPYRISAAYELTVALVESQLSARAAPPVLRRGAADQGVFALASGAPQLLALRAPLKQSASRLGEDLILIGTNLSALGTRVRFDGLRVDAAVTLIPVAGAAPDQLLVHLPASGAAPDDPQALVRWAPGFYALSLETSLPDTPVFSSNQIGFALAPAITVSPLTAVPGDILLSVSCKPQLRPRQKVWLVFGDRQVAPDSLTDAPDASSPSRLTFKLSNVKQGTYLVRLRVDGVDSIPVLSSGMPPLAQFDPNQQVTVQP